MTSKKERRCFTIMIVPHSEEATYSLRLPLFVVQIAVGILVLGVAGLSALGYAYLKAAAEAREAQALRDLNRAQQEEIDSLAIETEKMMDQLRDVDELVEFVTEKLELEQEEMDEVLENQSDTDSNSSDLRYNGYAAHANPHPYSSAGPLAYERPFDRTNSRGGLLERTAGNIQVLKNIVPERSDTLDLLGLYAEKAKAKPSIWPARGRITSGYGMRKIPYSSGYQFHTGVDIIGSRGSPIWATAGGEVTFSGYRGSLGNLLIIDHGHGYETYYAHLSGFAVKKGETVERGETIGYMGATGRTTGVHLHYEVHYEGSPVNPERYLD